MKENEIPYRDTGHDSFTWNGVSNKRGLLLQRLKSPIMGLLSRGR